MFTGVVSNETVNGLEVNTLGDGLFHAFNWLMTIALWRAGRRSDVAWSTGSSMSSRF